MKRLLVMTCTVVAMEAVSANTAYTSEDYVQAGLVVQWDGINNAGTGVHDSNTSIWKDLKGNLDLTLTANGGWTNGNALVANGISARCATAAPEYKTIEVVFKRSSIDGRALFSGGAINQFVVFDNAGGGSNDVYFAGVSGTPMHRLVFNASEICFASAQYDDTGATSELYMDSESVTTSPKYNTWYASEGVSVGGRYHSSYGAYAWYGEVYAIRLYNRRLTAYEMAHNYRVDCKRFLTATSYVQDGLLAHWDGIDNAGIGVHDPSSTIWMNLAPNRLSLAEDGLDLTIGSTGSWGESYLYCDGSSNNSKPAASGSTNFTFNALETVYENKSAGTASAILFSAGKLGSGNADRRFCCIGNGYVAWTDSNNDASKAFDGQHVTGMNSLSWSYSGYAYANGASITIESGWSAGWGLGNETKVLVGCRNEGNAYPFKGNVYAIRAYSGRLSAQQVAFNYKVDEVRFFDTLVWNGATGDFVTPGGWRIPSNERVTRTVPGVGDTAVLPAGDYTVTIAEPWMLGGLELGAGARLGLVLPAAGHDASKALLEVSGAVSAASGAELRVDLSAYKRDVHGSEVALISCGTDSTASLNCLASSLNATLEDGKAVVRNGTELVYHASSGMMIILR